MSMKDWLTGGSVVQGASSVQPQPYSVADVQYRSGTLFEADPPINSFTDRMFSVAPTGFNIPNPTQINVYGTPKQAQITKLPEVVKTNSAFRGNCK